MHRICLVIAICSLFNSSLFSQKRSSQAIAGAAPIAAGITDSIKSTVLGETRRLNIYLPDGYSPDSAATYPVIYLLDGGADEDFIHIVGLVRYNTTPWINRFPKSIVVGIENVNRRRDFTFAVPNLDFVSRLGFDKRQFSAHGGSAAFISFIETELQPFIKERYAANSSKTLIGESLAGLLATEILLKKPSLFDTYIILSPSLWWGNESLLAQAAALLKATGRKKQSVYIGACEKASSVIMYNEAKALADLLTKHSTKTTRVIFDYLPGETHATLIHQGVYNAFKRLYPIN